jgi:predicted Zn-dependent peptidase
MEEVEEYPEEINQVTKEQVKDVANKYFDEKSPAVGVVRGKR